MIERLAISLWQHAGFADTNAALDALDARASDAARAGSRLLIGPECGLTGYDVDDASATRVALDGDGPALGQVAAIARERGIALCVGFIEAAGTARYNAVRLVDRDGTTRLHYRKAHLWSDLDRRLFTAGDALGPVVETDGWRVAVLICYDVEFPESVRTLALDGAELVLVPTALMQPWHFIADTMVRTRAAESQVFLAYANRVGRERDTHYLGCSSIVAPDGSALVAAGPAEDTLLHATLEREALEAARRDLPYLRDRRPALYRHDG